MKGKVFLAALLCIGLAITGGNTAFAGEEAPSAGDFKVPTVTIEFFEVPQYDGYWYFSKKLEPTKGDAGDRGAPLPMSFLFSIDNPNAYPVRLEGLRFTVAIDDDFDLVTCNNQDRYWIPANTTDQVRITTMITVRSALLSLLVTGGYKLQERGLSAWDALEKWWKGVPGYSVPVLVKEGTFIFWAGDSMKIVTVEGPAY
jgi:hypothetical protein